MLCQKSHPRQVQAQTMGLHSQQRKPTMVPGSRAFASSYTSTPTVSRSPTRNKCTNTECISRN